MSKQLFLLRFLVLFSLSGQGLVFAACDDEPAPYVNWANCDMSGRDLSGQDLSNAVLTKANFDGANLSGALLENTDLNFASMKDAHFDGCLLYTSPSPRD